MFDRYDLRDDDGRSRGDSSERHRGSRGAATATMTAGVPSVAMPTCCGAQTASCARPEAIV